MGTLEIPFTLIELRLSNASKLSSKERKADKGMHLQ